VGAVTAPTTGRRTGAAPIADVLVWDGPTIWTARAGIPRDLQQDRTMRPADRQAWRDWQGVALGQTDLPDGWAAGGLAGLITRNAARLADGGHRILLLDRAALASLTLPAPEGRQAPEGRGFADLPALAELVDAGWRTWTAHGWVNAERGTGRARIRITVGLMPWLQREGKRGRYPLIDPRDGGATALSFWHWQRLTGTPFTTAPSGVATAIVMDAHPWDRRRPKGSERPAWGPSRADLDAGRIVGPGPDAEERPLELARWWRPVPEGMRVRAYDARRAYLTGWTTVQVGRDRLQPGGPREFDAALSGWWLADLAPWTDPRIPDPAARWDDQGDEDGWRRTVWVTTPTLELLAQLHTRGVYGGFVIRDSYLAAGERLLAGPAKTLDDTWKTATAERLRPVAGQSDIAARIAEQVKLTYSGGYGLWKNPHSMIRRPDWSEACIAQFRVNLWRKLWAVGAHEDRWPVGVKTDCVYYPVSGPDDHPWTGDRKTRGIIIGDGLGQFRVEGRDMTAAEWEGVVNAEAA
jgi:hypothetical protein